MSHLQDLFDLVKAGDLVGLKTRLDSIESTGQSLSEVFSSRLDDFGSNTMFLAACEHGHLDVTEFLLEQGSKIDERGEDGMTGLLLAAKYNHLKIVNRLIELGASVDTHAAGWGRTPLHFASENGNVDVVNRLCEGGASVNEKDLKRQTPLFLASEHGHLSVFNRLVELGASVNEKSILVEILLCTFLLRMVT